MSVLGKYTLGLLFVLSGFMTGCATYGKGLDAALNAAEAGDYVGAEEKIKKELNPQGADRLLYYMELAVLKHLQGDYIESNVLLERAERIAEQLETTSLTNTLAAFLTNPRQGDYAGLDFEQVFINYYKTLNYLALSNAAPTNNAYQDALESARIESRRLGVRLNALNADKGNYTELKDDTQILSTVLDIFYKLRRDLIDSRQIEYRDDAMAHYLTGITYETNREYDNARISYQKAALSYQDGFAKQFHLGKGMTQQAWFDVIRMMKKTGDFENEWPRLARKKLNPADIARLSQYDDQSQLIVIEHVGLVPQRKEMNIELSVNQYSQSLELRPYFVGQSQLDILAWFYMVYADKSLLDMVINYYDASFHGFNLNGFRKTISLGPVWNNAVDSGLISAIGSGLRITVPYYAPLRDKPGRSSVSVAGHTYPLNPASSPAIMGLNEQILNASSDIELALARSSFKAMTAQKTAALVQNEFSGLLAGIGRLATQLSESAETRNWLMLPYEIRVTRIPLAPGEHVVDINSAVVKDKKVINQQKTVILKKDDIQVMQVRSMQNLQQLGVVLAPNNEETQALESIAAE